MTNPPVVDKVRTSLTDKDLRALVLQAHGTAKCSPNRLKMLVCQLAMEHNAGADTTCPPDSRIGWDVWCYNFGNRRGPAGDAGVYLDSAEEILNGIPRQVHGAWPAFVAPFQGMTTWIALMDTHYSLAMQAVEFGVVAYVRALKQGGYFTASLDQYIAGVATWARLYDRMTW